MGANSTARSRRCRKRKQDGKAQLTIEVDEVGIEALLAHHGLISCCGGDNHDVTTRALERLLELLIAADVAQHHE
jgi:hypothetical protein